MPQFFLNGTAMSGEKDHQAIAGAVFLGASRTAPRYRFISVRDEFPGLLPVTEFGMSIEGELYDLSDDILYGSLLPQEPPELALGSVVLIDSREVLAMQLVPNRIRPTDLIVDIADFGGWRAYQAFKAANHRLPEVLKQDLAEDGK
jgi:hypothetical protein